LYRSLGKIKIIEENGSPVGYGLILTPLTTKKKGLSVAGRLEGTWRGVDSDEGWGIGNKLMASKG
jgi:hypothetical protein